MNDQLFWFIFWSIVLICIVVLTFFISRALYQLRKDLSSIDTTINNVNETSGYILEGTKQTYSFVSDINTKAKTFSLLKLLFKDKKSNS